MRDIISKRTRNEFREELVGWTLREIETEFDNEHFVPDYNYDPPMGGQRRSYVEQFYKAINFSDPEEISRLLRVYETIILRAEKYNAERANELRVLLERDGFSFKEGHLVFPGHSSRMQGLRDLAGKLDAQAISLQLERIDASVNNDPGLAVGTAKELVETVCKTILEERDIPYEKSIQVPKLVKMTMSELKLLPDQIPDQAKGAETIRRLLSNLSTAIQGLAEIRNLYGSGHGRSGKSRGLTPRHARLAVGTAATLATFLFETFQNQENQSRQ